MRSEQVKEEDERREVLRQIAEIEGGRGLIHMLRAVYPKVTTHPTPDFHYELAEAVTTPKWKARASDGGGLDEDIVREAPRGFAKTTVVAVGWPVWHAFVRPYAHGLVSWEEYVRGIRPSAHFALISKTRTHSVNNLTGIKDILDSPRFRWLFGNHGFEVTKSKGGVWTKDELQLPTTGDVFHARGTGQPIRGLNLKGTRLTGACFDDPEDENNTKTPEALLSNLDYLQKGLEPALAIPDLGGDKIAVIGTPIVENCMVRRLGKFAGWDHKRYAAATTNAAGERVSLWPEYRTLEWLDKQRAKFEAQHRLSVYYSEYMCEIVYDERRLFKKWGYWKGEVEAVGGKHYLTVTHRAEPAESATDRADGLVKLHEPLVLPANVFMGIDPASSVRMSADRTAVVAVAVDDEENVYVLPYFADRVPPSVVAERSVQNYERYKPLRTRVETTGYQEMLRGALHGKIAGLVGEKPRAAKSERLERMEPMFADGKVYLQPGMQVLEDELTAYPNASHDDCMDALYYATLKAYGPHHGLAARETGKDHRKTGKATSWMAA